METTPTTPPSLVIVACATVVEGLVLLALATLELLSLTGGRLTMGLTTAIFFAAFGALLIACGALITRGHAWARGPILLAQLIGLGLAWNLRSGQTTMVSVGIGVVALVVVAALLHPASVEALDRDPQES